jgi:hypothetical protein
MALTTCCGLSALRVPPSPPASGLPALEEPPLAVAADPALPLTPLDEPPRLPPEPDITDCGAPVPPVPIEPPGLVSAPLAPADVLPPVPCPGVDSLLEHPLSAAH